MSNCRWLSLAVVASFVFLLPAQTWAQALEQVSVKRVNDTARIRISFSGPVQVTRYFPEKSGKILYISINLPRLDSREDISHRQRISSIDRLDGDLPLSDVTFEPNTDERDRVIIRFTRTVNYKLQRGRDGRSIVVLVPLVKKKPKSPPSGANEKFSYVVNLDSQRRPIRQLKPLTIDTSDYRVYVTQHRKAEVKWYRLRLGFFPTEKSALKVRSRVRQTYPQAWVARASRAERVASRNQQISTKGSGTPRSQAGMAQQMKSARQALIRGENKTAISKFRAISKSGDKTFSRDALELLGLAYEREGDKSRARKTYTAYVKKYPKGDRTVRVKQRLANISRFGGRQKLRAAKPERKPGDLKYYGSWTQRYYTGYSSAAGGSELDQSSILSNLYINAKSETDKTRFRGTLNADHTLDTLRTESTKGTVRNAYIESKAKDNRYEVKAGRQSGNARGILSRYDGVIGGFNVYKDWHLYAAGGVPAESTSLTSARHFTGISVDTRIPAQDVSLTIFNLDATIDGYQDRQAVGVEARYFNNDSSGFAILDYDTYFNEPNILMLQTNRRLSKNVSYHLVIDQRKTPIIQLSNALLGPVNGTSYSSISSLVAAQPGVDIYQAAKDRTAISRSVSGGITRSLNSRLQVSGDINLSDYSGTSASEGQPATTGSGLLSTLSGRIVATDWLHKNSVSVAGTSLTESTTYNALSLYFTERVRLKRVWYIDANIRWYLVNYDTGSTQTRITPAARVEYRRDRTTFEFELGQETVENAGLLDPSTSGRTFVSLGYRFDF